MSLYDKLNKPNSGLSEITAGTTDANQNTNMKGFGNKIQAGDELLGRKVTKLSLELKNNGSAVGGTITFGVFNTNSATPVFTFGTFSASELTSSYQYFEEENLTGHTLTADQVLGFHASGDISNLKIQRYNGGTGARSTLYGMYWATSSGPNWQDAGDAQDPNMKVSYVNADTWTYPPEGIDSSGQIAQLSGSNAANSYTAASEFYTISTDTWASAFNVSGGARARAGSAGSTEHAYLMGGQDGSGYFGTIDKVAWADETNTTISRSTRAWGGAVQNAVSVCVGQSYYYGSYQTGINEYTYGTMAETSQGNTSSSHAFGGSFGNSTYGFVINGQNTGIERYTYSDKSKTASGFTASPTTTNAGGHTGNSTTGISINNTAGSGNARYDAYNISADTWTTGSATSSTPYEAGRASGSSTWNLWSTQTNTSSARQCEKYNYSSGALSSFTSVATNLDGGDQDAGASSINTGVNS